MANVPIVNDTKVADKHIDFGYNKLQFNEDMFGANVYEALDKLGKTGANISAQVGKKVDEWNKTKIVDITNQLDSYTNTALYDKDNGYFYKTGENAMGQSDTVMADYDSFAKELLEKSNLSGNYLDMAKSTVAAKRNNIFKSVHKHDADETKNWQTNVYNQKESNFLNQAILDRNDDERLASNLKQGYNIINLQAQLQEWDQPTVDLKKKEFASKYHIAVINGLLGDGSLRAKQYYEAHKNEIDPNKHNQILNAVNSNELKYNSNQLADEYMLGAKSEEEALQKAYAIENIDLSDATAQRIRQKYSEIKRIKAQKENELIDGFYDTVLQKQQNGQPLSYDDIPDELSSKEKLSLMNYINQNGKPTSEDDVWLQLYNMSVNNAQGFVDVNLNRYKGDLTDGEYKQFVKRQEEIKTGKYLTQIKDDDKMINEALKAIGLNRNSSMPWGADKKDIAYSEIRAMVREFEIRKGRSITDNELMDITNSLGYKDQEGLILYKQLEQGMRERTGFIKDVMNDFVYYQSKHNGEMPPNDEKMKIIQQRINQKVQEKKTVAKQSIDNFRSNAAIMRDISNINPKENEQKVLTYFADSFVPQIESDLGINLTVTSRYRNQQGSKHSEGRALDISMSEHTPDERIKIYQKLLSSPVVYKLGTSDPLILGTFKDNQKIKDERDYDKRKGTNHVNHVHITLINTPNTASVKTANHNSNTYTF